MGVMHGSMRKRDMIMPACGCAEKFSSAGGDPQSRNMAIVVEVMLDIRQIIAAQLVVATGGSIIVPGWLKNVAEGK